MQTQRTALLNQLKEYGWRVVGEEDNLEWWADEMWVLESVWSPVGSRAYVTFLVNQMAGHDRAKGEAVTGVMASSAKPTYLYDAGEGRFTLDIGQGWKERLPEFFRHLSMLRSRIERSDSA